MFAFIPNLSYVTLSAQEVIRLAVESISEIDNMRKAKLTAAYNQAAEEEVSLLFGLYRYKKYPTQAHADHYAPEVKAARAFACGDRMTCELLLRAAQHLLDDETIPKHRRVLHVTLNDFRALT